MRLTPPDKAAKVRDVTARIEDGMSLRKAAGACGLSPATYCSWRDKLAAAGGDAFEAFAPKKPTGRPPAIVWTTEQADLARWHRAAKDSIDTAVYFYCRDTDADPEIVAALRRIEERALEAGKEVSWPLSVRRAFHVTEDERARMRSRKAAQDTEMVTRRGLIWYDEEGECHDLLPGELWELDDYSGNQPFTYRDPQSGELAVGRQILAGMDLMSAGWLGFDLIGRPRDAYRGEDIVRFIARLFRAHGVPRFLRLERGAWESSYIHGLDLEGHAEPWGALDRLCNIKHVFKSKAKGLLEGSFNPLQRWLSHAGRDVGRHAGEFEESEKAWRQVRNAKAPVDPRALGFWGQDDCAAAHEEAANIMNSRPRKRGALRERVAADDLRARLGWHTTPLPAAEAWRLLPCKQRRVIRGGHVAVNPGGGWPELSFVVNGIDGLHLENGHVVLVACDPADPAAGAYIANGDTSARNRCGWSVGQVLVERAPMAELAPQIDLSGKRHGTIDLRRQAAAAAATEFRAVRGAGKKAEREVSVFDGRGAAARAGDLGEAARPATRRPAAEARPAGRQGLAADRATDAPAADRAAALRAAREAAHEDF